MKNKYGGEGRGGLIERGACLLLERGDLLERGGGLNRGFTSIDKPVVITEPTVHCSKHTAIRPRFEIIAQQHASHAQQRS